MATETMKTLRENAEKAIAAGVANKEQLLAAVPEMIALQSAVTAAERRLKETKETLGELTELCSEYAHGHMRHVFGDSFSVLPTGVESGDLEIDGLTYHFSYGFDGYCRNDPSQKLTKDFLHGLPDGWTREKPELNTTAINAANPTAEELDAAGLMRKPKPKWGVM